MEAEEVHSSNGFFTNQFMVNITTIITLGLHKVTLSLKMYFMSNKKYLSIYP